MKFFLSGLMISIIVLSSCQREIDWPESGNADSDSTFLSKVVYRDTTLPAGNDTFQIANFSYDNQRRLSRIISYYDYPGAIDTFVYDFRYTGSDSLPYLIVEKDINYNGPGTVSTDSVFYSYSSGMVVKDSSRNWIYPSASYEGTLVHQFSISGSEARMYVKEYGFIGTLFSLLNYDSAFYNMGFIAGNTTSQTNVDGGIAFYNNIQAAYDNKPNPFRKILKLRFPCIENLSFGSYDFQLNNPIQVQYDRFFMTDNLAYTYKYRNDGYPTSSTLFSNSGTAGYNKVNYSYTSL